MAGLGWLRTGTIAVTNGGRNVGGTDTIWGGGVVNPGDIILLPNGTLGEVESVGSNAALTLKQAYTGATASAQPYAIIRMLPSGNVAADLAAQFTATSQRYHLSLDQFVAFLDSTGIVSFSDGDTTIAGLHGLRKLMADIAAALPKAGGTVTGSLIVDPPGSESASVRLSANETYGGGTFDVGSSASGYGTPGRFYVYDVTANAERMHIDAAGSTVFNGPMTVAAHLSAGPFKPGQYTLSTLPSASTYNGYTITVSNASGGPALCLSNGTNWINVRTNAPVN
jgi:hypothetical protein